MPECLLEDTYLLVNILQIGHTYRKNIEKSFLVFYLLANDISIERTCYILITNAYVYWNTKISSLLLHSFLSFFLHASSKIACNHHNNNTAHKAQRDVNHILSSVCNISCVYRRILIEINVKQLFSYIHVCVCRRENNTFYFAILK